MSDQQSGLVKIGALWKAGANSKAELTGSMGEARLLVFTNNNKTSDRSPDYWLMVARKDAQGGQGKAQQSTEPPASAYEDDGIPF